MTTTFTSQAVFHAGGELAHQHGETAIANEGDGLPARISHCRRNGVGESAGHGRKVARTGELLVPRYIEVAGDPGRDRPGVRGDDRIVGDASVQLVGDDLRLHGLIATRPTLLHQLPPVFHPVLRLREESPVLLGLHLRQQRAKDAGAISDEADVSRISEPDALRVDVDLHTFRRRPGFG